MQNDIQEPYIYITKLSYYVKRYFENKYIDIPRGDERLKRFAIQRFNTYLKDVDLYKRLSILERECQACTNFKKRWR